MAKLSLVAAAAISIATSACVVFPTPHHLAPMVSGVLLDNGQPVADAEVVLTTWFPRSGATRFNRGDNESVVTRTDANGRFEVGPLVELRIVHPLFGDEWLPFSLVIRAHDKDYVGFSMGGTGSIGRAVSGYCDLSKPVTNFNDTIYCDHYSLKKLKSDR